MEVKCRVCLFIVLILLFIGSMWLYGSLDYHHEVYNVKNKAVSVVIDNSSGDVVAPLAVCPGQSFQIAYLLAHLQSAPFLVNDVLLKPYLASWDELIKFLDALGPIVGIISREIESKTAIIRNLAQKAEKEAEKKRKHTRGMTEQRDSNSSKVIRPLAFGYTSVHSMIKWELEKGLVNFQKQEVSGCRTLLLLHRALFWLQNFLEELGRNGSKGEPLRRPAELCQETYQRTLARHHSWWARKAAELAFLAMPERPFFYKLVCVETQEGASVVLNRVVRAIKIVYKRNDVALREHGMLNLP